MYSYADREIIVSGFTMAALAIFIGCIVQFTHHGTLNHVFGYGLVACGVVLLFLCQLARGSRGYALVLRTLLMSLAGLLLVGVLLKDAFERLV
jgi:hypothetical protein